MGYAVCTCPKLAGILKKIFITKLDASRQVACASSPLLSIIKTQQSAVVEQCRGKKAVFISP